MQTLHYVPGTRLNASINRDHAYRCLKAGMTPDQIADEWPKVWKLTEGKLSQKYDSVIAGTQTAECPEGLMETRYTILKDSVDKAIRKHKSRK